jgi:5'-nucleotidase
MAKEKRKPLILVSNDDGVQAKGLAALIEVVKPFGDVFVVAPEKGESGKGHAITINMPIRARLVHQQDNVTIYSCTGTPVDSVKLALNQLIPRRPDFMVSGINHGSNASISVIYSGTMGAAIEGCLNSIPSAGFSLLNHSSDADFTAAKTVVREVFANMIEFGLPLGVCLNVNVPDIPLKSIKGVRICRQTKGVWKEEYEKRMDPHKGTYYWLTGDFHNFEPNATDTDEWALAKGYAAIVPVEVDLTSYDGIHFMRDWTHALK